MGKTTGQRYFSEVIEKMQEAIDDLWTYTDELFYQTKADKQMVFEGIGVDVTNLKSNYYSRINDILVRSNTRNS